MGVDLVDLDFLLRQMLLMVPVCWHGDVVREGIWIEPHDTCTTVLDKMKILEDKYKKQQRYLMTFTIDSRPPPLITAHYLFAAIVDDMKEIDAYLESTK